MQGLLPDGSDLIDPATGEPTRYFNSGDPVTGHRLARQQRGRQAHDALLGAVRDGAGRHAGGGGRPSSWGRAANRLSSVAGLRFFDTFAQDAFDKDFDLPSPPSQPKVEVTVDHGTVDPVLGRRLAH